MWDGDEGAGGDGGDDGERKEERGWEEESDELYTQVGTRRV